MVHRVFRGSNSGWSTFEGSHPFRLSNPLGGPTLQHTPPRIEHPHPEMRSVIGGVFYRGEELPELKDHYLYGCFVTREIWAVHYQGKTDQLGEPFRIARTSGPLVSIREDHHREILFTSLDGQIERMKKRTGNLPDKPWPSRLSETGLFADVATLKPTPGVYEYLVNAEGWADGATRRRFVAIPPSAPLQAMGEARYYKSLFLDLGGAFTQTFFMDGTPVETQILYNGGIWKGTSYRWNEDGTDAKLVVAEGVETTLDWHPSHARWRFPSRSECLICHTQKSMYGIAFTPPQLDRTGVDGRTNQLDDWISRGLLKRTSHLLSRREDKMADPYDAGSGTLEERARAYLDVNCAHCHRETGLGGRASFELMSYLKLEETGMIDQLPMVGLLGKREARIVAPGHPDCSELLGRMNRRGAGQMPLLGSFRIDEEGCRLIRDWIESLEPEDSP